MAVAHDLEETDHDPTAHAELLAIRKAAAMLGKDLSSCSLYSTHEPCPMCATAIVWAQITHIGYGYGIRDAIKQGRRRVDLSCIELFSRAGAEIQVEDGLCKADCVILYDQDVRAEVRRLRRATDEQLIAYNLETTEKRVQWFNSAGGRGVSSGTDLVRNGYELLLKKLGIIETEAPIFQKTENQIVFHSINKCPTLEACKILQLDTRRVCRLSNEGATNSLLRQFDQRLSFSRNYERLRPYSEYCEEIISLRDDT